MSYLEARHAGHDMPSMMMMVFQTEMATPLYANSWTPLTPGAYAGTCIFLALLAVVARLLLAARSLQEARWHNKEMKRRYVAANGKIPFAEQIMHDPKSQQMTLSANGLEETVFVVAQHRNPVRPWRLSIDPLRATLDTIIVGVGYLLMLAVMTMNVGYFLSVLAGVFVGSLAVGRFSSVGDH